METENPSRNHYVLCSPNTTMKSMLLAIADAINTDVKGDNDRIQMNIPAPFEPPVRTLRAIIPVPQSQ